MEQKTATTGLGIIETQFFSFGGEDDALKLVSGKLLAPITVAYETYGTLNAQKDNAILVEHAFSGSAHAAGFHHGETKPGWWDDMIGLGKAFDTDKYFVICSNVLGSCNGTTGPASKDPETGKPYGLTFPVITIEDMVNVQVRLINHLGIEKLFCVAGGSMGGMQVLQWVAAYPHRLRTAIPIACALKHSPQQIAFDEVGRQAIMSDPQWHDGSYFEHQTAPERGLAVARMIGHITYMSEKSMEEKFSRKMNQGEYSFSFNAEFEVERYLRHRGGSFVKRFDANAYLYITKAMDYFDLSDGKLFPHGKNPDLDFLVISFASDWLYPPYQMLEIAKQLKVRSIPVTYCEVKSTYGHDAFLLETQQQTHLISHFLKRAYAAKRTNT
jgi:homoserine O-acetyltransferase